MKRLDALRHEFVEYIPDELEHGVLYISISYATAVHLCACGCGNEAVNPLAPHGWSLTFDGRAVSLSPSIGNWSFACRSHYWIRGDQIDWAYEMSPEQIETGRARRRWEIDRDQTEDQIETEVAGNQLRQRRRRWRDFFKRPKNRRRPTNLRTK